ncbi:DUF6943 family protein [Chondrinema litorale]|uniref:DUF6943 family protein n=1 Tax=Chondrinema litorale TaxID=2994555 RepID=UPI002542BA8C|nr:hypothetical protein [Chondrinema litorale]UZR99012.1 hypothetical protein OQ292_33990 [Chondrinema litorale]
MFVLHTYHPNSTLEADFYIQSKGSNAGKPMKTPSANCFGVLVDQSVLLPTYFYYLVEAVYSTGIFKKYLKGSVIEFLTIEDFSRALNDYFSRST